MPRPHRDRLAAGREQERLFAEKFFDRRGGDFRGRADADRQGRTVEAGEVAGGNRIVGVEDRETLGRQVVEKLRLRQPVILDGGMEIEVIAADVRHAGGVEADAGHARLAQRMTGDFHHGVGAAVGDHAGQPGGQGSGRGRGQRRRLAGLAVEIAQRPQQPHRMPRRGQHAGQQATGGGLAVGAGNADELQAIAGIAGQGLADAAVGVPRVGHHAVGQAELRRRPLGEDGAGAAGDRLGDEIMPVAMRCPATRRRATPGSACRESQTQAVHADVVRAEATGRPAAICAGSPAAPDENRLARRWPPCRRR